MEITSLTGAESLTQQGQAVLAAMAQGHVSPADAASAMSTLIAQARIVEVDELTRRVEALEARS